MGENFIQPPTTTTTRKLRLQLQLLNVAGWLPEKAVAGRASHLVGCLIDRTKVYHLTRHKISHLRGAPPIYDLMAITEEKAGKRSFTKQPLDRSW